MDTNNIGRIIKEARLAKKMTQAEVVGDFITRNMLSQIESGSAMPSVKTLDYLCNVRYIQLTPSELAQTTGSPTGAGYLELRKLYEAGDYEKLINASCSDDFKDEFTALRARAYLELARQMILSESISDDQLAVEYAKKAAELAKQGIFKDDSMEEKCRQIIKAAATILKDYYSAMI